MTFDISHPFKTELRRDDNRLTMIARVLRPGLRTNGIIMPLQVMLDSTKLMLPGQYLFTEPSERNAKFARPERDLHDLMGQLMGLVRWDEDGIIARFLIMKNQEDFLEQWLIDHPGAEVSTVSRGLLDSLTNPGSKTVSEVVNVIRYEMFDIEAAERHASMIQGVTNDL